MQWARKQSGFTIVELLIVVVVIAILAAITIVAYNGITQRARTSIVQNEVNQATKSLMAYAVDNNETYPNALSAVGIVNTDSTAFSYSVNNSSSPRGFCVSVSNNNIRYYMAKDYSYGAGPTVVNKSSPAEGYCPGHGVNTTTNHIQNPSAESSLTGYYGPNASTRATSTVRAYSGTNSVLVSIPDGHIMGNVGVEIYRTSSFVAAGLKPNTTYTATAYVYIPTGVVSLQMLVQGSGRASVVNQEGRFSTSKNSWNRLENTFTTSATDGNVSIYVMNNETTIGSVMQFWADAFMLTEGTSTPAYADGSTAGWIWTGAEHLSPSIGPAQ